jgi:hypothetical protein
MANRASRSSGRAAAASGISFVVLFIGGVIPLGPLLGNFADSDGTFNAYFSSASNRTGNIIGGALLAASAFVFLWFLHHLRDNLQPDDTHAATLPNFVRSSGQTFVTLLLVGTAALVTVPVILAFAGLTDDQPLAAGQAVLPQFGYVVLALFANWAAAAMVLAATVSARRTQSFPRWLCRLGYVVTGFLLLFGFSGGGAFFALPIWVLAVSIHWWRSR